MANPDSVIVTHAPAVKVGGRRLSISSRPKQHGNNEPQSATSPTGQTVPVDYPRPAPPGDEHETVPPHHDDEVPKKEKKHGSHDNEKKFKESSQWKAEATRPTRDILGGRKDFGAGGRISQPAGKGFAG